jgi:hypothetical protein
MRIEVSRQSSTTVGLKVEVDKLETVAHIPIKVVSKLEAMLAKAKSHMVYKCSLICNEDNWSVEESFDFNNL